MRFNKTTIVDRIDDKLRDLRNWSATDKANDIIAAGLAGAIITGTAFSLGMGYESTKGKVIPNASQVQTGYVSPDNLAVRVADEDRDGNQETVLEINGVKYGLMEKNGQPTLVQYSVKP